MKVNGCTRHITASCMLCSLHGCWCFMHHWYFWDWNQMLRTDETNHAYVKLGSVEHFLESCVPRLCVYSIHHLVWNSNCQIMGSETASAGSHCTSRLNGSMQTPRATQYQENIGWCWKLVCVDIVEIALYDRFTVFEHFVIFPLHAVILNENGALYIRLGTHYRCCNGWFIIVFGMNVWCCYAGAVTFTTNASAVMHAYCINSRRTGTSSSTLLAWQCVNLMPSCTGHSQPGYYYIAIYHPGTALVNAINTVMQELLSLVPQWYLDVVSSAVVAKMLGEWTWISYAW